MAKTFLRAEWRKLAIANYAIDPKILAPYLPAHTELDFYDDVCYVSLIGFMFLNTAIKSFKIPFHVNFEEVNLRFYVRHNDNGKWKRGVVFLKEIVPKRALAFVANTLYGENYEKMPMTHQWQQHEKHQTIAYSWKKGVRWDSLKVETALEAKEILGGSIEEFITEHYWGYTKLGEQKTSEYGVEHPRWQVYEVENYQIDVDFGDVYGKDFELLNNMKPKSVLLAEGSVIEVKGGRKL